MIRIGMEAENVLLDEFYKPYPLVELILPWMAHNFNLYLITKSNNRDQIKKALGSSLSFKEGYYGVTRKPFIAAMLGLSYFIDDNPEQLESIKRTDTMPVIYDQPYNSHLRIGVRIRGWQAVGKYFEKVLEKYPRDFVYG